MSSQYRYLKAKKCPVYFQTFTRCEKINVILRISLVVITALINLDLETIDYSLYSGWLKQYYHLSALRYRYCLYGLKKKVYEEKRYRRMNRKSKISW